jgi:proline iminopeptidase
MSAPLVTPSHRRNEHPAGPRPSGLLLRRQLLRASLAVLPAVLTAVLLGRWMPRGPVTAAGVLSSVVVCAAVGFVAGRIWGSRWALPVTPLVFAVAYEAVRVGAIGPSVDRPRVDSTAAVLALVLGRGVQALLQLLPITLGAVYGSAAARRAAGDGAVPTGRRRALAVVRHTVAALGVVGLVAVAAVLTRSGSTAPILGADRRPLAGSVAELATVRLGDHDQTVLICARSASTPVLLYLAGGPGQSDLGYTRAYMPTMEDDVVFAVWDQRGTGTSYAALDPSSSWTLEQAVSDTVQLTDYLRARFHQDKIYLFGNSWGTILGTLAVQRHPEKYAAYIGAAQMVDVRETDRIIYGQMLAYAERTGDSGLRNQLRASGEPPYPDAYGYATQLQYYDKIGPYPKTEYFTTHEPSGIDGNGAAEYGPLDKVNKLKGLFDMFAVMYPQLQDVDLRRDAPRLEVPVYLVQGAHELTARADLAADWYAALKAPGKYWVTFPRSGHIPQFEEFDRFHDYVTGTVLPETSGR